jgi:CrcB protein
VREVDAREYAAIFCGGFVGAIARIALAQTLPGGNATWPWATFSANLAGAFLLGYFTTRLQERLPVSSYRRPLLGTGFCGAFTTFSTLQLELVAMANAHRFALLLAYAVASLGGGFAAVWLATALVRRVRAVT